jgi:hypothetical protein
LLFCAVVLLAQDEVKVTDTVITTVKLSEEKSNSAELFDSVGQTLLVDARPIPQRLVDSLKAADDFWYAASERKKAKAQEKKQIRTGGSLFQKQWFRNLLWAVILGSFCGVVLWYLISSNILLFRKKSKSVGADDADNEADNIFERDYETEIAAATSAGNFRLAVRLLYLHTLKNLSAAGMIDYRYGRTNQDYVADMRSHSQHPAFSRLTRHFEYIWYGQFPLSAEAFRNLQADFTQFKNSLPS